MSMLKVASDSSTVERRLEDLYPGGVQLLEWEKCLACDREVDGYIYTPTGERQGFCFNHIPLKAQIHAE